jgi:hypothetical protein
VSERDGQQKHGNNDSARNLHWILKNLFECITFALFDEEHRIVANLARSVNSGIELRKWVGVGRYRQVQLTLSPIHSDPGFSSVIACVSANCRFSASPRAGPLPATILVEFVAPVDEETAVAAVSMVTSPQFSTCTRQRFAVR